MRAATLEEIDMIERLAAAAWPAEAITYHRGWRLRTASAPNRRVNSVLPLGPAPAGGIDDAIAAVEAHYRSRGTVPRFQMSPACDPSDLDAVLDAKQYQIEAPVALQAAAVDDVAALSAVGRVRLGSDPDATWLMTCWPEGTVAESRARRDLLDRIRPEHSFALLSRDSEPAAVGLAVLEAEWLGIFCMRTASGFRRAGAAQTVLAMLARWGKERGARSIYLQVEIENLPAIALYEKVGFRTLYRYHYRTARP